MFGLEVFAVVGAVAAVISAYKDGGRIVAEIKEKRARRKAPPPTVYLEQSLSKGPPALEEAKNNGIERFGRSFAIGDSIATESLKDILISLQSSLLKSLRPAAEDDDLVDFSMLVDVSDWGRIKAVSALHELHMRMAVSAPIIQNPSPLPSAQLPTNAPSAYQRQRVESEEYSTLDTARPAPASFYTEDLPSDMQRYHVRDSINENSKNSKPNLPISRPKSSSQKFPWFSKRKPSQVSLPSGTSTSNGRKKQLQQQNRQDVPSHSAETEMTKQTFITNPWQDEASASGILKSGTRSSFSSHATTLTTSTWPSPANEYSGFCKGAYYLQVGLNGDGMRLRNMSTAKTGEAWYWGCQNKYCVFEGPACKVGKDFLFDNEVRTFKGMKYRWSFLAKSHIAMTTSKARAYSYRCIFCVLKGVSALPIKRISPFLEHVAEHQTQHLEESILHRTLCINDRVAADDEDFDINFPPSKAGPEPTSQDSAAEPVNDAQIPIGGLSLYDSLDDDPWRRP